MVQQSSTVLIEELTGQKRSVTLVGAALPRQGAAWGGQLRMTTKWYPGNSGEATQQVLGPIELPSEWEGEWNTTRMIGSPSYAVAAEGASQQAIVRASTMRDVLEQIFMSGPRLRVTWASGSTDDARRIVREGRAAEWKFAHARQDDISWSIKFEWVSRGRVIQRSIALRGEDVDAAVRDAKMKLADAISQAVNDTATASAAKRAASTPASAFSLGDLEAFANGPLKMLQSFTRFGDAIVNRLKHIGDLALKMRGLTSELASECVDTATNAIAVCNQFVDAISHTAPETLTLQNKVSNLLQVASYYGQTERNVEQVADAATTLRERSRIRIGAGGNGPGAGKSQANAGDVLGVWVARAGDTYAMISQQFYGTPDHGYAIAKANAKSLPPVFVPGTNTKVRQRAFAIAPPVGAVLIIPNLVAVKDLES